MSFFEFPHTRTYDSDLGWIIRDDMTQDEAIAQIKAWIQETQPTIDEFSELYNQIVSGNLPQGMIKGISAWMDENALELFGELIKFITVSLDNTGHIRLNYPEQWNVIQFNTTGLDITTPLQPEYGHLTISY